MEKYKFKKRANTVLGTVGAIFATLSGIKYFYPGHMGVTMAQWVTEAALVGGIADWFAVTALFKRPLGFPWHTELVPRSRDKIIAAIAGTVEKELFSKELLRNKLEEMHVIDLAVRWLDSPGRKTVVHNTIKRYIENWLYQLEPHYVARVCQYLLRNYLRRESLASEIAGLLRQAIQSGNIEKFSDYVIMEVRKVVNRESTKQVIYGCLENYKQSKRSSWWRKLVLDTAELTNTLNLEEVASALHYELVQFIEEIADRYHPMRRWIDERLVQATDRLEKEPQAVAAFNAWQRGVFSRMDFTDTISSLLEHVTNEKRHIELANWVVEEISRGWELLVSEDETRQWMDTKIRDSLLQIIDLEHNLVALVVTDALSKKSDEDLNRLIEDKVGEDLAWIRINGSVVGGAVGLFLFLFLHYFYHPYVVPLVKSIW